MRVVVALGGNAMIAPDGRARPEDQRAAVERAALPLRRVLDAGHQLVVTHGNGPQVGNLLVKNELAADVVPPVPLDWCGAQTQGTIGALLLGVLPRSAALVSRTLVDAADPGFRHPSKPIGRYLPADEARRMVEHGQSWEDRGTRGWRRVVASPEPLALLDVDAAAALLDAGFTVVCSGGGGIPVVAEPGGRYRGVEAVVDKDLTAALLAATLRADVLVIATDVEAACTGYGTSDERPLGRVSVAELRTLAARGEFAGGSMAPKVEAACRFVERGGVLAAITSLDSHRRRGAPPGRNDRHRTGVDVPDPIEVRKIPLHSVTDASELEKLLADGVLDARRVVAVIGKTEGNGGVNDYTRIIADRAFRETLVAHGRDPQDVRRIPIVWSGGTDGVISPHATVFATLPADRAERTDEPRLTVGYALSEPLLPEDIGRTAMVRKVADAVQAAMQLAGITDPADVHYVQTKTPLLTIDTIRDARSRGHDVATEDTLTSMDVSNGTTALGVAVALGEIDMPTDAQIMGDRSLYSAVASCSSGVELDRAQVVVVGNARGVGGRYRIGHAVMRDALDAEGIWDAIRSAGLELPERARPADLDGRLVNVFLKCEASQDGQVRGRRNAMLDDSDVHWHRQIKACVGGVAAAVTGDPAVFVSVSAAHQGPDGGGPVAAIVDLG